MELRRRSSTPQDAASRAPRFGNSLRIAPRETSGTEGSNPSSSSSESRANLISTVGVVGSKRVFNLANPAEILSPLMLAACGAGKRRVQGSAPGSGVAARHVHDPQKTRSTRIYSASFSNTAGKVSRNLNPAHKLLEGIAKLFGMAKVTGAAAGRDFLRNHNHTRGVCWLGRSFLPADFPDPDRPCERNPGPPHRGFFVSASFAGEARSSRLTRHPAHRKFRAAPLDPEHGTRAVRNPSAAGST